MQFSPFFFSFILTLVFVVTVIQYWFNLDRNHRKGIGNKGLLWSNNIPCSCPYHIKNLCQFKSNWHMNSLRGIFHRTDVLIVSTSSKLVLIKSLCILISLTQFHKQQNNWQEYGPREQVTKIHPAWFSVIPDASITHHLYSIELPIIAQFPIKSSWFGMNWFSQIPSMCRGVMAMHSQT